MQSYNNLPKKPGQLMTVYGHSGIIYLRRSVPVILQQHHLIYSLQPTSLIHAVCETIVTDSHLLASDARV